MADKPKRPYNLSPDGRRRLRESIQRHKPWEKSTGPRTPEGKLRSAANSLEGWSREWLKHCENPAIHTKPTLVGLILIGKVINMWEFNFAVATGEQWATPKRAEKLVADLIKWSTKLVEMAEEMEVSDSALGIARRMLARLGD